MATENAAALLQMPSFAVPEYLNKPPTGELAFDLVPLLTMVACVPTLWLFHKQRRYADLVAYSGGFVVAVVYHTLALHAHNGLSSVSFLGIHGAGWRTIDIMGANVLLARTMGHALHVDHPVIALLPNVALPFTLVLLLGCLPGMGLALASRVTAAIAGLTLVLQLVKGGHDLLRSMGRTYSHPRAVRAVTALALGIFSFVMPTLQPERYWLWHSLWHVLMGAGYYDLYEHLMNSSDNGKQQQPQQQQPHASVDQGTFTSPGSSSPADGHASPVPSHTSASQGSVSLTLLLALLQHLLPAGADAVSKPSKTHGLAGPVVATRGRTRSATAAAAAAGSAGVAAGTRGRSRSRGAAGAGVDERRRGRSKSRGSVAGVRRVRV